MCGRTCLTLCPIDVVSACKYRAAGKSINKSQATTKPDQNKTQNDEQKDLELQTPEWRSEYNCGLKYTPTYNITPSEITPVLISASHFDAENVDSTQRLLVPMLWGMIPRKHKGDYRKHGLTTNNCRLEHMLDSKLYCDPFRRGQRCVVVCEGFYEWQTTKTAKPSERAVHLLYAPQAEGVKIYDRNTWMPENVKLLKLAGLFDVWEDENGDKIYSYSIITFESSKLMSWMHHRMPAILETEQQVQDWLDFKRVSDTVALATLRPATQLEWHRVTNFVNNSRNKSEQCNKPFGTAQARRPVNKMMQAWINVRKRREDDIKVRSRDSSEDEIGSATSTSESEHDNPTKRPRFSDFKRDKKSALVVTAEKELNCDKTTK